MLGLFLFPSHHMGKNRYLEARFEAFMAVKIGVEVF
jgi:hypothetical protein